MGGGKIDCYLDLASYFSYVGFTNLRLDADKLVANGVEIEFHPVLLGGINSLSGNKPPWLLEAKAKYLQGYDSDRAARRVGLTNLQSPKDLMAVSHTVSPNRALLYIKANYSDATFVSTMRWLFNAFWTAPNVNLIPDENLRTELLKATETLDGGKKLFTEADVDKILAGRALMKDVLKAETGRAVELGAFGAPWFSVTNARGEVQPFFGSDRFNHIYKFLEIPFQDVAVLAPSKL